MISVILQIAPNVILTDEEIEYRMKQEYQAYLDEESAFLRELGLLKEEDEPLPETWSPTPRCGPPLTVHQTVILTNSDILVSVGGIWKIYFLLWIVLTLEYRLLLNYSIFNDLSLLTLLLLFIYLYWLRCQAMENASGYCFLFILCLKYINDLWKNCHYCNCSLNSSWVLTRTCICMDIVIDIVKNLQVKTQIITVAAWNILLFYSCMEIKDYQYNF